MKVEDVGAMIPTTQVWDVSEIYSMDVKNPEFKELLVRLYQNIGSISQVINNKDTGVYHTDEFLCGQIYFPNPNPIAGQPNDFRQVYRKVVNFGALLDTATKTMAHDITITPGLFFTRIYGITKDPVANIWLPLPYSSPGALGNAIELNVNGANITVITGSNRTAYTQTYIVLEYLKQ
jgi:hypothetical protein